MRSCKLSIFHLCIQHISVYSRLHLLQSYTRQSADLLWQSIELETLDILTMAHDMIADHVDLRIELRHAVFLL
eukprot:COSAG02_NODE_9757_length_2119_cov_2.147030_3_plen_73_part_00